MASRAALGPVVLGVVALLAGAVLLFVPFLDQKREVIASTPATLSPNEQGTLRLKPNDQLCVAPVPLDSQSQVLRFGVVTGGKRGGPLAVTASAPGGVGTQAAVRGGYPEGPVEVPLRPQAHDVLGRICVRNTGQRPAALLSTPFGRRFAPVQTSVNGLPVEQDVPMTLHARDRASLASRVSQLIAHASVIQPLPAWALWLLLAAVLLALPAAVFAAVAAAAAAPAGVAPDPRRSARPIPLAGASMRVGRPARRVARRAAERVMALPDAWLLGALVALAALFLYFWASRTATFQLDENQYVYLARWIDHDSSAIFNFSFFMRGLQRLEVWLLAVPLGVMRSPNAFFAAHALNALAFASVSIPMFLVARGLGVGRRWALLAALLGVAVPWTVYATSFLTEPLAYPLSMWVIWAIWRATTRPSIGSEVLALALLLTAGLARSAFLVLAPALPLAVLAQELRYGGWRRAAGARARIGAFARELWARHRVVTIVLVGGAVALALSTLGALPALRNLSGGYGTPFNVIWGPFFQKVALYASRVAVGVGFLPFAVGLPWLARELVAPRDARRHAFAVTALLAIALILYASASAGPDERYAIYLAPPLVVAAVVALARREIGPLLVGAGGVLAALLIWRHGWNANGGPYGFFIGPAESFYARVGLLRLGGHTPFSMSVQDFAFVLELAFAGVCAYAFTRRPRAATVLAVLVGALVVLQLTQAQYSISKYVDQAGARATATPQQRAWIDAAIYGKAKAAIFATGQGNTGTWDPTWRELQFWNTSLTSEYTNGALGIQVPIGDRAGQLSYDPRSGALSSDPPLPPYIVLPRSYLDVGPAATPVAHASYIAADLWRLDQPHQVRFVVTGPVEDGLVAPGVNVRVRVFTAGLGAGTPWCAGLPLFQPVAVDGRKVPLRYHVAGPGGTRVGTIAAAAPRTVALPLRMRAGAPYEDIELTMRGRVEIAPGRPIAGQLGQVSVNRCS